MTTPQMPSFSRVWGISAPEVPELGSQTENKTEGLPCTAREEGKCLWVVAIKGMLNSKTEAKGDSEATGSPMGPLGRLSGWAWSVRRGPFNQEQVYERGFTSGSALGLGFHSTESLKGWFSQHQVTLVSQKK